MHEGRGNGSMIVFTPDGQGNIVNDTKCIEQVKQIMASTPGLDNIVYDRGAYVLDVDVNDGVYVNDERRQYEIDSGISFPVILKEYWERALNQAQQDPERKGCNRMSMVRNKNTFEHVTVKALPKPCEPTKEERQSHEATHCPFRAWCEICVKAKSPDGKHAKKVEIREHILVIEFDYAFATDTLGGPKISMMVATDSIHGSIFML